MLSTISLFEKLDHATLWNTSGAVWTRYSIIRYVSISWIEVTAAFVEVNRWLFIEKGSFQRIHSWNRFATDFAEFAPVRNDKVK